MRKRIVRAIMYLAIAVLLAICVYSLTFPTVAPDREEPDPAPAVEQGVLVRGEVRRPGIVPFRPDMTAKDAIESAGGILTEYAGPIRLLRGDQHIPLKPDEVGNVHLEIGDHLVVLRD